MAVDDVIRVEYRALTVEDVSAAPAAGGTTRPRAAPRVFVIALVARVIRVVGAVVAFTPCVFSAQTPRPRLRARVRPGWKRVVRIVVVAVATFRAATPRPRGARLVMRRGARGVRPAPNVVRLVDAPFFLFKVHGVLAHIRHTARDGVRLLRRCSRTLRTLRYLIIPVQIRALRLTNASRSCCLLLSSILPPCDGEARLRELIVCQARLRDCGMGNSLDCGLGDCGSPDDAESDYSKPVEYSQVLGPASNAKGTFSARPASHL